MRESGIISASFDVFPAPKGAATHIEAFACALGEAYGAVDLLTVLNPDPMWTEPAAAVLQRLQASNVRHHCFPCHGRDMIARALMFRSRIAHWWPYLWKPDARQVGPSRPRARVVHVRSIFEGYPIAIRKSALCDYFVYEVNGLPSIELKYHHASVADDSELLAKLSAQEDACLGAADLILTPSVVTADYLLSRGVPDERMRVIPNGVDSEVFEFKLTEVVGKPSLKILYSGTMTAWQGVYHALEALRLYLRDAPAALKLVGPLKKKQRRRLLDHVRELGLGDHVEILEPVSREQLAALHHQSDVVLVPLLANDRNCLQGCCPLKLLEAMASGTPVVVSDLPVTRVLATPDVHAVFVRPGSAKAIKDGLLRLAREPGLASRLSLAAGRQIEARFQWRHAQGELIRAYDDMFCGRLSAKRSMTVSSAVNSF